ncbi:hypothetical protein [Bacteroides caecimuris]|jgi:hypothetical protein|uniref:hypothetical protein n=1 Tax=Bacteroides caecimuris TaxID=1796613 RepID=UPI002657B1A5|nr:hypothetical protein [Bacteroides caecimuris]
MIDDGLLAKFDRIQDLPVSEEMLGAYMENKLDVIESEIVSDLIDNDLLLMNLSYDLGSNSENYDDVVSPIHEIINSDMIDLDNPGILNSETAVIVDEINAPSGLTEFDDFEFNLPEIDSYLSDCDDYETTSFE